LGLTAKSRLELKQLMQRCQSELNTLLFEEFCGNIEIDMIDMEATKSDDEESEE
jgi:hypothetical protein